MNDRRRFLQFMGATALSTAIDSPLFAKQRTPSKIKSLRPQSLDQFVVAEGFSYHLICKELDEINKSGVVFGSDADFTQYIPLNSHLPQDGFLWVNHEHLNTHFLHEFKIDPQNKSKEQVDRERIMVGGSLLRIRRDVKTGQWKLIKDDPRIKRFHAASPVPFAKGQVILGSTQAAGTLANCSGGRTPWGSILSCEEVYRDFYGERNFETGLVESSISGLGWPKFYPEPPEHYGWVVEINPLVGTAKKLIAMGRFQHEGAATILSKHQTLVAYMGDDQEDQCLYKFIASKPGSLEDGILYVADLNERKWKPLVWETQGALKSKFTDQLELLIRTREAAQLVGGTKLNRPEGIAIHPKSKDVFIALTNNKFKSDSFGSILKIKEKDADPLSLQFEHDIFLSGGSDSGFACPDNLTFDAKGDLWMTTDFSSGENPYLPYGNNSLFYIPLSGPQLGEVIRIASAPNGAELTGPSFSFDNRTLFLSVQHPGGNAKSASELTSHWPEGGSSIPKSAVVAISGPAL